ncbi:hypothetical protein [Microbacterium sp. P01]|uniref:hypothetical protein n=1 Tax=unclassified Microbacterium TaxID=2609290 RepID=UPI00366A9ECE
MTPLAQALLYGVSVIILLGTLIVFVMQLVRSHRDERNDPPAGDDRSDPPVGS